MRTRIVHTARSAAGRHPRALAAGGEQGLAQRLLRLRRPGEADQLPPAERPIRRVTTQQQDSHLRGANYSREHQAVERVRLTSPAPCSRMYAVL